MRKCLFVGFLFLSVIQLACADRAFAIATFSRQHKTECTTCHTIYPELNEYGEAFRKNGYIWFGKAPGKQSSGAEQGTVNEGLLLAAIPEQLPVSVTASFDASYDEHPANNNKVDLSTRSIVLQAGGALRDKAGFYMTYNAYTQGLYSPATANAPDSNKPNINELFLVWHHAYNSPFNIKIGRMQPQLTLWKRSNRLTVGAFAPSSYRVGKSTFSIDAPVDAAEVNAILGNRTFVAGGLVDRDGQNSKEGYGHFSFKLGGADFVGHEPEIDLDSDSIWDYSSITVGAYGYSGKNANLAGGTAENFNNFYRVGLDLDFFLKQLRVRLSGVHGRDSNPQFLLNGTEIKSLAGASEAEYMFDTNIIGAFRFEYLDDDFGISRRYIPSLGYAPLQSVKLTLEYRYEDVSPYVGHSSINRLALFGGRFSF